MDDKKDDHTQTSDDWEYITEVDSILFLIIAEIEKNGSITIDEI
jgi:hypothetical protein